MAGDYLHLKIIKNRQDWTKLLWAICDNNMAAYTELKKLDTIDFFVVFQQWKEKMEALKKQHEQQQAINRKR